MRSLLARRDNGNGNGNGSNRAFTLPWHGVRRADLQRRLGEARDELSVNAITVDNRVRGPAEPRHEFLRSNSRRPSEDGTAKRAARIPSFVNY